MVTIAIDTLEAVNGTEILTPKTEIKYQPEETDSTGEEKTIRRVKLN